MLIGLVLGAVTAALLAGFLLGGDRGGLPQSLTVASAEVAADVVPPEPAPAMPMPAAGPLSEPTPQDFDPSPAAGLPALATLWSIQAGADTHDCAVLRGQGLECLQRNRNTLHELRKLDLPAVIDLRREGAEGRGYALLRQLGAEGAVLYTAGGPHHLDAADLQRRWTGDYLLLWRRGSDELRIGPANRGASVLWLRSRLSAVLGREIGSASDEQWDRALQQALLEFQRRQGLKADGVAGVRTLVALSDRSQGPRLSAPSPGVSARRFGS